MSDSNSASSGIGFGGFLFLVFLVLKLTEVINWSWWWVTAPLWGGIAILLAFLIIVGVIAVLCSILSKPSKKRYR